MIALNPKQAIRIEMTRYVMGSPEWWKAFDELRKLETVTKP